MADTVVRELAIGAIGSVIGAVVVYLTSTLYHGAWSAAERSERWRHEVQVWSQGRAGSRQALTNEYLFSAFRWLFLGNVLWMFPEIVAPFARLSPPMDRAHLVINSAALVLGLLAFFIGLGVIVRYGRLRSTYDPLRSRARRAPAASTPGTSPS